MVKIFFDLDGTLINSKNRMYNLFQKLVPESKLSYDEYWDLKHQKINHKQILERFFHSIDFDTFNKKWLAEIETKQMLELDFLYPDAKNVLKELKKENTLYVLTARQNKEHLLWELQNLGVFDFFDNVFLTQGIKTKDELICDMDLSNQDILVGDTGYDILCAEKLGLTSIAITHGFLPSEILKTYAPNKIIDSLNGLL